MLKVIGMLKGDGCLRIRGIVLYTITMSYEIVRHKNVEINEF